MKSATYKFVWNRKGVSLQPGDSSLVQLIVYYKGRKKVLSTGIYLEEGQWNPERQQVKKHKNQVEYNRSLERLVEELKKFEYSVKNNGREFSLSLLEDYINGQEGTHDIIGIITNDIESRSDLRKDTKRNQLVTIQRLKRFSRIREIQDLTYTNIMAFDDWMRTEGYDPSTIQSTHKRLSTYIKRMVKKELIPVEKDPYKKFIIKGPGPTDRKYLTDEELFKIESKQFENERLNVVRDLFVFSCYTGVAYGDVMELTKENIVQVENEWILRLSRLKTEEKAVIMLLPKAIEIIERYRGSGSEKLLPVRSNQKMNEYLKEIADLCGIDTKLTTHVARHTFATTVLLMKGVSMESTQRMLGHKSIKTTEIYGKIVERRIIDEMQILRDKMSIAPKKTKISKRISQNLKNLTV